RSFRRDSRDFTTRKRSKEVKRRSKGDAALCYAVMSERRGRPGVAASLTEKLTEKSCVPFDSPSL
ncbi:MAG: hypothetical protein ACRD1R_17580, partial [Acidobacteriota bacterium]